jgi:hypothetical protein
VPLRASTFSRFLFSDHYSDIAASVGYHLSQEGRSCWSCKASRSDIMFNLKLQINTYQGKLQSFHKSLLRQSLPHEPRYQHRAPPPPPFCFKIQQPIISIPLSYNHAIRLLPSTSALLPLLPTTIHRLKQRPPNPPPNLLYNHSPW